MRRAVALAIGLALGLGMIAGSASAIDIPAGSRLERIKSTKTIRIAHRADASPFAFLNDKKEPTGYTVELCKEVVKSVAQELGADQLQIQWVPVTTQTRFEAVAKNQADMECGSSTVTLSRRKQVDFSAYVFVETTAVVVNSASTIRSAPDLQGKSVAVIAGTTNQRVLEEAVRKGFGATLVAVRSREEGVAALEGGKVDGFASDRLLLAAAPFKVPNAQLLLPDDLSFEPYAIALPLGDWALRLAVDEALAKIYRSGQIVQIFDAWFGAVGLKPGVLLKAMLVLGALPD